jgi:hypothetical protein
MGIACATARGAAAQTAPKPADRGPQDVYDVNPDADAADRYEIEVYGSATVAAGHTMFELHSNYTPTGFTFDDDGTIPDNHALHESLEITRGFTDWFELGIYDFNSENPGDGWALAGTSIRPRVRAPESWGWPVGVSVSQELEWMGSKYSVDSWTYELRPIVDKQIERLYIAVNPTFDHALRGPDASKGFQFAPSADVGYDVTAQVNLALEYYLSLGRITNLLPSVSQQQQLFYAVNLNLSPSYEINFGYGVGLDRAVEKRMIKLILGRRM